MAHRPCRAAVVPWLLAVALTPLVALESDQYYRWSTPLADATQALNTRVAIEIDRALAEINGDPGWADRDCDDLVDPIARRFRQFIFHEFEVWVTNTSLIERLPDGPEDERRYRQSFLYRDRHPLDLATQMPPSPTVAVGDVRVGADKFSHFFSEGQMYFNDYRAARRAGKSAEQAQIEAIDDGIFFERTILGKLASGVFSVGDLEANYRGMLFYIELCEGDPPLLIKQPDGWRQQRTLDFRDHVDPSWDESFLPPIYTGWRWRKVRPALLEYCPLLEDEAFAARREAFARRLRPSPARDRVQALIEAGKLRDPAEFGLEANCPAAIRERASAAATESPGSPPRPR